MKTLAIIGAGDLGQLIAYHAIADKHYANVVFFDDTRSENTLVDKHHVIGKINDVEENYRAGKFEELIVAVGYKHMSFRQDLFFKMKLAGVSFGQMVHTSSYIDKSCRIGEGVVILPGCCLDRNVVIESNVLLNTACTIAHDTSIGNSCFLSPRVAIAGFTQISESCVLGINSTVIDNIQIGKNIQIGGGAVVTKNLMHPGLYVGMPAILKKNYDHI